MAKNIKLLPCPFCGAKARMRTLEPMLPELPETTYYVECSHATSYHHKRGVGCPVMPSAHADTQEEAAKNWNTRSEPQDERVASRCYTKSPCNHVVRCPETGEAVKDIRAKFGLGKPARMPTMAAAEGAARWMSELTGRTFVAEEVSNG